MLLNLYFQEKKNNSSLDHLTLNLQSSISFYGKLFRLFQQIIQQEYQTSKYKITAHALEIYGIFKAIHTTITHLVIVILFMRNNV